MDPRSSQARLDRRSLLQVGVFAGLSLGDFLRARAQDAASPVPARTARADALIHIHLPGGMAHQDSFDPKPYSPVEYRGSVEVVGTNVPGVQFARSLGRCAQIADRLVVVRSFSHGEAAHERGEHNMLTGYRPSPAVVYPSFGSVIAEELGPQKSLPPYACVPQQTSVYQGTGYLSASFAPFSIGADPASGGFVVRDLDLPEGVDEPRFARRKSLLEAVDTHFRAREKADALDAMDEFYARAYDLLSSSEARRAFRLAEEPDPVRDEYGRHTLGQSLLLARRLVEAGVRAVGVTSGGWDLHQRIQEGMNALLPTLDQALATLIIDLERRGLLDRTLVLVTTEFGRTPKINKDGGRDHWPGAFSVVLAGGGVKRGLALGATDPTATEVAEAKVGPEDLGRTLFTLLGIDPDHVLLAGGNRPIRLVNGGRLLEEILA